MLFCASKHRNKLEGQIEMHQNDTETAISCFSKPNFLHILSLNRVGCGWGPCGRLRAPARRLGRCAQVLSSALRKRLNFMVKIQSGNPPNIGTDHSYSQQKGPAANHSSCRQVDGITALSLARKADLGRFSKNRAKPSAKANGK